MTDAADPTTDEPTPPDKVEFHYLKSNDFRIVHADGIVGGPSPTGKLTVSFFSERLPIPRRQVWTLDGTGRLAQELESERETRAGVVRDVEVGVVMDLTVAKSLVRWLVNAIADAEAARQRAHRILSNVTDHERRPS